MQAHSKGEGRLATAAPFEQGRSRPDHATTVEPLVKLNATDSIIAENNRSAPKLTRRRRRAAFVSTVLGKSHGLRRLLDCVDSHPKLHASPGEYRWKLRCTGIAARWGNGGLRRALHYASSLAHAIVLTPFALVDTRNAHPAGSPCEDTDSTWRGLNDSVLEQSAIETSRLARSPMGRFDGPSQRTIRMQGPTTP